MKRLLPPLVLLLFLGFVVWRTAEEPRREAARTRLDGAVGEALTSSDGLERLLEGLDEYLEQYGSDPGDRRYVAETLLKIDESGRAMETLWDDPDYRARPGSARDLAGMVLASGALLEDDPGGGALIGANLATLILAEGGLAEARARLDEVLQTTPWQVYRTVYYGTSLYAGDAIRADVGEDLRSRDEPEARDQAAILAMRPEDYPEREKDLERLLAIAGGSYRQEHQVIWSMAVVALGRSESPEALAFLREAVERLGASEAVADREHGAFAALGLVAGGVWDALDQVRPFLEGPSFNPMLLQWTIHTLASRWHQGDEGALEPIETLWREGARTGPHRPRLRLAFALFLRDALPAVGDPVDRLAADLDAEDATAPERVQGAAIRFRRGADGARDELVGHVRHLLRDTMLTADVGLVDPLIYSSLVQGLRTLYLYDR